MHFSSTYSSQSSLCRINCLTHQSFLHSYSPINHILYMKFYLSTRTFAFDTVHRLHTHPLRFFVVYASSCLYVTAPAPHEGARFEKSNFFEKQLPCVIVSLLCAFSGHESGQRRLERILRVIVMQRFIPSPVVRRCSSVARVWVWYRVPVESCWRFWLCGDCD
ncbi:hypothetical protein B0H34DRAFT_335111 [Crassisporium funariophilum]|nr:hypothetical protein B0H34DRAFT_335111 [Crassisporium funariophilum]